MRITGEIQAVRVEVRVLGELAGYAWGWRWQGGDVAAISRQFVVLGPDGILLSGCLMHLGPYQALVLDYDAPLDCFIVQRWPSFGAN